MSAIRKSKWIISINKASYEVNIHVNAKLFFSSWRAMFVWSGNFQGHVCAGRFTRPCIVHTEFWRLVCLKILTQRMIFGSTLNINWSSSNHVHRIATIYSIHHKVAYNENIVCFGDYWDEFPESERSCICVLEVMYLCVRGIDCVSFYDFGIWF